MKIIGNLVWLITAIGSIHLGLVGLGYNFWAMPIYQTTLKAVVVPVHYLIGIAGLVSLVFYVMAILKMKCPGCGCEGSGCKCK